MVRKMPEAGLTFTQRGQDALPFGHVANHDDDAPHALMRPGPPDRDPRRDDAAVTADELRVMRSLSLFRERHRLERWSESAEKTRQGHA